MDNISYLLGATEAALFKRQDRIADQVANANTTGFKLERDSFEQVLVQTGNSGELAFSQVAQTFRDMSQGPMVSTGRTLDVAIKGDGFFVVETPLGERYTRDGSFTLNIDGDIVTKEGYRVTGPGGQQITLTPEDTKITIREDGTVVAGENQEERGRIGVISFENNSLLERAGGNLYIAPEGVDGRPTEDALVAQGMLEGSNVNQIQEMTDLINLSRDIELNKSLAKQMHQLSLDSIQRLAGVN